MKVLTIAKVAFKKLPIIAMLPLDCVQQSLTLVSWRRCLDAGAVMMPVPCGVGSTLGTSLFLYGHNLHDLVLEFGKEEIDNLVFFDRK